MALQFGRWLDPDGRFGRTALSPIAQDFAGLAPLYLQAGGREILRDMIGEFAVKQAEAGSDVLLDIWPTMPHDFQLFDSTQIASTEALARVALAVRSRIDKEGALCPCERTDVAGGLFTRQPAR